MDYFQYDRNLHYERVKKYKNNFIDQYLSFFKTWRDKCLFLSSRWYPFTMGATASLTSKRIEMVSYIYTRFLYETLCSEFESFLE